MSVTLVLMGVAGSGKSSVMDILAERLGWVAAEGDAFHSPTNVRKMRDGHPLDDRDRGPWLTAIGAWISRQERAGLNAIVTCSALKRAYRDRLRDGRPSVWFVHLVAPAPELAERMRHRVGHYMPSSLLASQLADLEPLDPDEPGATLEATTSATDAAERIVALLDAVASRPQPEE